MLIDRINKKMAEENEVKADAEKQKKAEKESKPKLGEKSIVEQVMGATITRQIVKEIVSGLFGMLTGKKPSSRLVVFLAFKGYI